METIKEEKKADLGQLLSKLLNDLLKMGWKPFNRDKTLHIDCYDKCKGLNYKWVHLDGGFMNEENRTLRELVSIDSGLWQFVCENGMVKFKQEVYSKCIIGKQGDANDYKTYSRLEYRLIESALKDESELEDFLLNSIVINND